MTDGAQPAETEETAEPAVRGTRTGLSPIAAIVLLVAGALGLLAAFTLSVERYKLFLDPSYRPSCSLNPVLSCGSVMVTDQAAFFGFPNPYIGIAAFAVVVVIGVQSVARIDLPRWFWAGLALGSAAGVVFIHYLIFQSLYRIHALCPYCMVVWVITPIILILAIGRSLGDAPWARFIRSWLWPLLIVWYAIVIVAIGVEFWDYWSTLI
ncbi:vitamin K epoxide reductase family protein [Gordonia hankookensis]|uniref:Vitamin K epoxide reductase family protein n=1 Tax=Gordonia hankookensis TaxID=589403 RepID=A0ABR7WEX1_9ACTN|nr:vitamin K epoxide reductase family protein [Gordonia hankookensis]MBD1321335.1 vitamin K epoxide reductase family protein [Gordonia hankookensis]NDZ97073.1 vitamin K epoxide reductase family protein [Streptomyces sp. SID11726]NEB22806.1 vitamin K epoxide reductase family protein [Streptomyces sp. SID6673]